MSKNPIDEQQHEQLKTKKEHKTFLFQIWVHKCKPINLTILCTSYFITKWHQFIDDYL